MKRLIDWFKGRSLRNKPHGMAWIRGLNDANGAGVLNGRAVRTERLLEGGKWEISPIQQYVCTNTTRFIPSGIVVVEGQVVQIVGIADDCLEPWKDAGISESEVRELYEPRITTKETTS